MRKINLKFIVIWVFILGIIISLTWNIAVQHTWKEARKKYNPILDSNYANIIYAFSTNKEKDLLKISTSIIRTQIVDIERTTEIKINSYDYLCPMMNNTFKKLILDNFNEEEKEYAVHKQEYVDNNITIDFKKEKSDFEKGYKQLLYFCKK